MTSRHMCDYPLSLDEDGQSLHIGSLRKGNGNYPVGITGQLNGVFLPYFSVDKMYGYTSMFFSTSFGRQFCGFLFASSDDVVLL